MNKLFKWFLENIEDKEFTLIEKKDRRYHFYNFGRHEVPHDIEIENYLIEKTKDSNFVYECYHIHKWNEGDYFSTHKDNRDNRKFSYVVELKESDCKTKLLVNGNPIDEGFFDVHTEHEVPIIKKGQRISLTIFGKNKINRVMI